MTTISAVFVFPLISLILCWDLNNSQLWIRAVLEIITTQIYENNILIWLICFSCFHISSWRLFIILVFQEYSSLCYLVGLWGTRYLLWYFRISIISNVHLHYFNLEFCHIPARCHRPWTLVPLVSGKIYCVWNCLTFLNQSKCLSTNSLVCKYDE